MSLYRKIRGTIESLFQIGLGGPQLKNSSGAIEARNSADSAYAVFRVGTPAGADDANRLGDFLLANDPPQPGTTYSLTRADVLVTQELWVRTAGSTNIKSIDYTYTGNLLTTEVRKVYAVDGSTVIAQLTVNYTYSGNLLTGETATRDV